MSKKPKTKLRPPRNPYALPAKRRKAGVMKDKRNPCAVLEEEIEEALEQVRRSTDKLKALQKVKEYCIYCGGNHENAICQQRG